jgi:hypothetical protein
MNLKYMIWIIVAVLVIGAGYYFFVAKPKADAQKKAVKDLADKHVMLSQADEKAYNDFNDYMHGLLAEADYNWWSVDVGLYFPGGAREDWVKPDLPGGLTSKLWRIYTATNELANVKGWKGSEAKSWAVYAGLHAKVAQSLLKSGL